MEATEEAVSPGAAYMEGFERNVQNLVAYFYTDNRTLAMKRVTHLQREFDTLTKLFDHVGLRTNVDKIVSMACQPCFNLGPLYRGLRLPDDGEVTILPGTAPPESLLTRL